MRVVRGSETGRSVSQARFDLSISSYSQAGSNENSVSLPSASRSSADMLGQHVTRMYIRGRTVDLDDRHKRLFRKYRQKPAAGGE